MHAYGRFFDPVSRFWRKLGPVLMLPVLSGWSQETIELSPLNVVANRRETRPLDVPQSVSVQNAVRLQANAPRTMADMLSAFPGVMVQRTGYGQTSPYIRGLTGFHTLLLVDGIRVNNAVFRSGPNQYWATIDPLAVGRLEMLRGSGALMYGSDAVGGVVNVVTPVSIPGSDPLSRAYLRASSAERSWVARLATDQRLSADLSLLGGVSFRRFGDLEGGAEVGTQDGTGYDAGGADVKLQWRPNRSDTVTLATQWFRQNNVPRTHSTVDGIEWEGTTRGSNRQRDLDQLRSLSYLRFEREVAGLWLDAFEASLSWQVQEETEDRIRGSGTRNLTGFEVGTLGLSLVAHSTVGEALWDYGVEWYRDGVSSFRHDYDPDGTLSRKRLQGAVGDDASYDWAGAFIQASRKVYEKLTAVVGARFNYMATKVGQYADPLTGEAASLSRNWDRTVFSGKLSWDVSDKSRIYVSASESFRAPNLSDLTRFDIARSNEIEIPAPDLSSESFVSYEIGYKYVSRLVSFETALFRTDMRDLIVRAPTGRMRDGDWEVTKRNGGDGKIVGWEVAGAYRPSTRWEFSGHLTWLDGEQDVFLSSTDMEAVSEPLSRVMPTTIQGTLVYRWVTRPVEAHLTITHADRADRLSTRDKGDTQRIPPGGTPSYTVADLFLIWRPNPTWTLSAGGENLFDEDYRVHGSGSNAPGRNLVVTLDLRY